MGRGLSDLQRSILMLAAQNRFGRARQREGAIERLDLTPAEVYVTVFGWDYDVRERRRSQAERASERGKHFISREIGVNQYNCVRASVCRAFERLRKRGYVERWAGAWSKWSGIVLTDEGLKIAGAMLAAGELPRSQED